MFPYQGELDFLFNFPNQHVPICGVEVFIQLTSSHGHMSPKND